MVIRSSGQTASVSQRDEYGEILSKNANACSSNIIAIIPTFSGRYRLGVGIVRCFRFFCFALVIDTSSTTANYQTHRESSFKECRKVLKELCV